MSQDQNNTESEQPIRFRPLSEGLGLNHFADGLPYAAPQKNRRQTAPLVHFQFPIEGERARSAHSLAHPRNIPELTPQASLDEITGWQPAGVFRRLFSYSFDLGLTVAIFFAIVWAGFSLNGFDVQEILLRKGGLQFVPPLALLYIVIYLGYFLIQEITWQRTIGKALVGIRIQTSSGIAILGRMLCFFIAVLPMGIGLFWYFFDQKHRCWHDVITDTEVVLS